MREDVISADCHIHEYIAREPGHLPAPVRRRIVCEYAARLYGFPLAEAAPTPEAAWSR
jgi:hypothetical protein